MNIILEKAYQAWAASARLRERRQRYKNYTYGDQWCDIVTDDDGRAMREDILLRRRGNEALKNNLIRQLVKTVVGRYRSQAAESGVYGGADVADLARRNSLAELDARLLEEFLISGCAIQRISTERRWDGTGTWVDNVELPRFFVNSFRDPRGWDIKLIGMLHDMTMPEIVNRFSGGSRKCAERLRAIYSGLDTTALAGLELGAGYNPDDFFTSQTPDTCRVIEVWTFDSRPVAGSATLDFVWHCRYIAPDGSMLSEFDSPYAHRSHPFAVKFYPLTDGEVHSFVEDVIDQQKYINRIIVMIDKMMATSAKGVLLFPDSQKSDLISWDEITRVWARSDGVIPVTGRGMEPHQVVTSTAQSGAYRLLEMQMKLFDDISGVGDALLGRSEGRARGVDMFDTQIRNATIALADIFDTFTAFTEARTAKALTA